VGLIWGELLGYFSHKRKKKKRGSKNYERQSLCERWGGGFQSFTTEASVIEKKKVRDMVVSCRKGEEEKMTSLN